jgi:hypothetical protein
MPRLSAGLTSYGSRACPLRRQGGPRPCDLAAEPRPALAAQRARLTSEFASGGGLTTPGWSAGMAFE